MAAAEVHGCNCLLKALVIVKRRKARELFLGHNLALDTSNNTVALAIQTTGNKDGEKLTMHVNRHHAKETCSTRTAAGTVSILLFSIKSY